MAVTFRSELGEIHLTWSRELQRIDRSAARGMLRRASASSPALRAMRALLAEMSSASVDRLDDEAVVEQLAARMEAGEVVALRTRSGAGIWSDRIVAEEVEAPPPGAPPMIVEEDEDHWLRIRLVDDEGNPVPGERYRVALPDGRVIEGRLDSNGLARVENIDDPGSAKVTFPDREGKERRLA